MLNSCFVFLSLKLKKWTKKMFALIHKNLHRDEIAIFISKTTFHRWLNGGTPHLWHLNALDKALKTNTTIAYVQKFSNVALQLSQTNELSKVSEILSTSGLNDDEKSLLGDHHKRRIWRKLNKKLPLFDEDEA